MKDGTKVKVVSYLTGHDFRIGQIVTRESSEWDYEYKDSLGFAGDDGQVWYMQPDEYEIVDAEPKLGRIEELEAEVDKLKRDIKDIEREYLNADICWNAVLDYVLNKGYMESPMEFLRCWNQGNFEALREEWPDAPEEIYLADPLYKGKK